MDGPPRPYHTNAGDVWLDTSTGVLRMWTGRKWKPVWNKVDIRPIERKSDWDEYRKFWRTQYTDARILIVCVLILLLI